MPNRSFYDPNDETDEDDSLPYQSVSNRPPLEDTGDSPPATPLSPVSAPDPIVKEFLSKRMATSKPPTGLDADPLMQQYQKDQSDLEDYRRTKLQADNTANLGESFSHLALGANAPQENKVFKNIQTQNQELLGSKEKDLDRRRKVMEAIESRKAREALESGRRDDRNIQREQIQATRDLSRQDRKDREAKLSEKQSTEIQDFDDSLATMKSVMGQLGQHSDWTGPVDGRLPDAIVGADQVAFRSELGRMVDKYRKLITGAGASNQELKKLEGRLPQPTDTYANFVSKANNFMKEVERGRGSFVKNLSAQGKNTKPFESGLQSEVNAQKSSEKVISRKLYSPSRNQTKVVYTDGSEEVLDGKG